MDRQGNPSEHRWEDIVRPGGSPRTSRRTADTPTRCDRLQGRACTCVREPWSRPGSTRSGTAVMGSHLPVLRVSSAASVTLPQRVRPRGAVRRRAAGGRTPGCPGSGGSGVQQLGSTGLGSTGLGSTGLRSTGAP
ncbi:hypothetical protein KPATCC21470_7951 [Kitasatospora purpeofusca]